jgi:hypothetical protein
MAAKTATEFGNIKQPKKRAFLRAYAETGNVSRAAELAGISRATVYTRQWLDDAEFQAAKAEAMEMAADRLEQEAWRRAVEGVDEPVGWFRGEPGGTVKRYSDTLLIFMLKGTRPEKFRERYETAGAVEHVHRWDLSALSEKELATMKRLAEKAQRAVH